MCGDSPSQSEHSSQPQYDSEAFARHVLRAIYELQVVGRLHPGDFLNDRFPDGVPQFLLVAEHVGRTPWDPDCLDRAIADLTVRKLIECVGKQEGLMLSEYVCPDGRLIWYGPVGNQAEFPQEFAVRVDGKRVWSKFRPSWDCPIDLGPLYTVTKAGIEQLDITQEATPPLDSLEDPISCVWVVKQIGTTAGRSDTLAMKMKRRNYPIVKMAGKYHCQRKDAIAMFPKFKHRLADIDDAEA